jgi:NitT/TauT family transport system substrate-binding protein
MARKRVLTTVALTTIVLVAACGSSDEPGQSTGSKAGPTAISMGIAVKNDISNSPLVLAEEQGIYKKFGLDVELVYFQGGGAMVQAMAGGQVDYGWVSHTPVIKAASQGVPVKVIAEVSHSAIGWGLMVPPNSPITKVEDLKPGVKISYTSEGALTQWLALYNAGLAGVKPDQVQGAPIGGSLPTVITALEKGQVDAATVLVPWGWEMEADGKARWISKMPEQLPDFSYTGIHATDKALKDSAAAGCVIGAYGATISWMKAHPDETKAWFQKFYTVSETVASRAYDELMPDFNADGSMSEEAMQKTIDTIQKVPGFLDGSPKAADVLKQIKPGTEAECAA